MAKEERDLIAHTWVSTAELMHILLKDTDAITRLRSSKIEQPVPGEFWDWGDIIHKDHRNKILFYLTIPPEVQALRAEWLKLIEERDNAVRYGMLAFDSAHVDNIYARIITLNNLYESWEQSVIVRYASVRRSIGSQKFHTMIIDNWKLVGLSFVPVKLHF